MHQLLMHVKITNERRHIQHVHVYTCTYQVEPSGGFDKSVPADSAGYAGTEFLVQGSQGHSPSGRIHMYTYMYSRNTLIDIQSQFSE